MGGDYRQFSLILIVVMVFGMRVEAQRPTPAGQVGGSKAMVKAAPLPIHAGIEVNWNKPVSRATPYLYGTNDSVIINPQSAADDTLAQSLQAMAIPFLRLCNRNLSRAWTEEKTKTWDAAKIKAAYDAPYLRRCLLIQNIPGWPAWMKQEQGLLDPSEYDNYAAFCADLVRIVNGEQGRRVVFWEPLNEQEDVYVRENRQEELWTIYNKAVTAMKQSDPTIKVGGIPFTTADPAKIEAFLNACGPNIDFLSWRFSSGSDGPDATDRVMRETPQAAKEAETLRALVRKILPNRKVPLVLDAFSFNRSSASGETRQGTNIGAVWSASVLKHLADAGVDMAASWNLKDSSEGLVDLQNRARPVATVYAWGNQYLIGEILETSSSEPMVETMAVRRSNRSRHLLLINKSGGTAEVLLKMQGKDLFGKSGLRAERLDEKGYRAERMTAEEMEKGSFILPPYSLLILHLQKEP